LLLHSAFPSFRHSEDFSVAPLDDPKCQHFSGVLSVNVRQLLTKRGDGSALRRIFFFNPVVFPHPTGFSLFRHPLYLSPPPPHIPVWDFTATILSHCGEIPRSTHSINQIQPHSVFSLKAPLCRVPLLISLKASTGVPFKIFFLTLFEKNFPRTGLVRDGPLTSPPLDIFDRAVFPKFPHEKSPKIPPIRPPRPRDLSS